MRRTQLVLPYPPSANVYWRTALVKGRPQTYVSEQGKAYREEVQKLCAAAGVACFTGGTSLRVAIFRPRRAGDASNRIKVLEDALRELVYADDDQNVEVWVRRFDDAADPRVEVTVLEGVNFEPPPRLRLTPTYEAQLRAAQARLAAVNEGVKRATKARRARKAAAEGVTSKSGGRWKPWWKGVTSPNVVRPR
jgi:crossover junction endodeoxyribonuclease RusA